MATKRGKSSKSESTAVSRQEDVQISVPETPPVSLPSGTGKTGRYLVLLQQDGVDSGRQTLEKSVGLKVAMAADLGDSTSVASVLDTEGAVIYEELGVAVVNVLPDHIQSLSAATAENNALMVIEEERIVYAINEWDMPSYLAGYQAGVEDLAGRLSGQGGDNARVAGGFSEQAFEEKEYTWGLHETEVIRSSYTGKGVRVAVLDTGFDLQHPDFIGRKVVTRSFIEKEDVQDGHGHGTHCIGTALGSKQPGQLPRYGIAYEADIYAGKVLSNRGSGSDSGILAGIQWAIRSNCAIISMSLGAAIQPGETYSKVYESVAKRALNAGTLIIAAAGNESQRPGRISPVGHPANCPSIISVAALDSALSVAFFSCGGINAQGGQIDIAGPGVKVRSSWPKPKLYNTISGTSMATPHVAGIAALWAQANPDMRGASLGWLLLQSAKRLNLPTRDAGAGLVQAPLS